MRRSGGKGAQHRHRVDPGISKNRMIAVLSAAIISDTKRTEERVSMMRKYNISLDGTAYCLEVEEILDGAETYPERKLITNPPEYPRNISYFMPGTIAEIYVALGQTVAEGDVLMILEAMKMENEIVAPQAGTVVAIHVSKGTSVKAKELLVTLDK